MMADDDPRRLIEGQRQRHELGGLAAWLLALSTGAVAMRVWVGTGDWPFR